MDDSVALNEKYDRIADNDTRASVQMHTDTHTVDMTVVLYYSCSILQWMCLTNNAYVRTEIHL